MTTSNSGPYTGQEQQGHYDDQPPDYPSVIGSYHLPQSADFVEAPSGIFPTSDPPPYCPPPPYSETPPLLHNCEQPSEDEEEIKNFSDLTEQSEFIRKVYTILGVQVVVSAVIIYVFTHVGEATKYFQYYTFLLQFLFYSVVVFWITVLIALACFRQFRPMSYVFLSVFTLVQSFLVAGIVNVSYLYNPMLFYYSANAVLIGTGIVAIFCIVSLFEKDFDTFGDNLFVNVLVLFILGTVITFFANIDTFLFIFGVLGALIYCFFLVMDTRTMLANSHRFLILPEEHIFAALILYINVFNIFIYFVSLICRRLKISS